MLRHPFEEKYESLNTVLIYEKALRHNLKLFHRLLPGQSICPVLKSNAYGHDLLLTAKILDQEKPAFLIVDSAYEAYQLIEAKIQSPLFVMGYTRPEQIQGKYKKMHFALFDLENAADFARHHTPLHIEIDTGLSRMGFSLDELREHLPKMKELKLNIVGVFTHLADADNPKKNDYTKKQVKIFQEALNLVKTAGFKPRWVHVAASAGGLKARVPEANMVRLGISLYGINPYSPKDPFYSKLKGLQPALELRSQLAAIRHIKKGQKVGYAGTFTAQKDMQIGIVPTGYFEAIPRQLGRRGFVEVRKKLCPIIGRVCMNYIMVDLSPVQAKKDEPVIIYSKDVNKINSIENVALITETIPNEILVHICESLLRKVV